MTTTSPSGQAVRVDIVVDGRGLPEHPVAGDLSDKTARSHLTSVLAKLGVRDRAEAIVGAREAGLGRASGGGG